MQVGDAFFQGMLVVFWQKNYDNSAGMLKLAAILFVNNHIFLSQYNI